MTFGKGNDGEPQLDPEPQPPPEPELSTSSKPDPIVRRGAHQEEKAIHLLDSRCRREFSRNSAVLICAAANGTL